ncbi:MAG: reverse transcriptase domain-containing protein [Actinomycetota bacterium]|jgi:hypothetical protein|nr:reverse transcriptase domain-containing protein [Actinomycetota bacterium]
MHYAFDRWMARNHPGVHFEQFADDAVVHVATKAQAEALVVAIGDRMAEVGLRLHPTKTRIMYKKDGRPGLDHEHTSCTFLGVHLRSPQGQGQGWGDIHLVFCRRSARTLSRR